MPFVLGPAEMVHCFSGIGEPNMQLRPGTVDKHSSLPPIKEPKMKQIELYQIVALRVAAAHMKKMLVVFLLNFERKAVCGIEKIF